MCIRALHRISPDRKNDCSCCSAGLRSDIQLAGKPREETMELEETMAMEETMERAGKKERVERRGTEPTG